MIRPLLFTTILLGTIGCVDIQTEKTELVFTGKTSRTIASDSIYPVSMQVAPRGYILNVLKDVFSFSESAILKSNPNRTLVDEIYKKMEFGGGCDVYEASESAFNVLEFPNENCGSITPTQAATSNPMRFAITAKVCEDLLANDVAKNNIKRKIFSSGHWGSPSDNIAIKNLWRLFYPTEKINTPTIRALETVGYSTSNEEDAWKAMIFTVCSSPGWQIL